MRLPLVTLLALSIVPVVAAGQDAERDVADADADARALVSLSPPRPEPEEVRDLPAQAPAPLVRHRGGSVIDPAAFAIAASLTAALLGASIASGVDVESAASAYRAMPTPELRADGLDRELRTTALIAATGAAAAVTAALAVFTDWGGASSDELALRPLMGPELALLTVEGVIP